MIKIFIVDDSALVRKLFTELFSKESDMDVVGSALDPIFALSKMKAHTWPDVIVLDIEMPRMDGITFLRKIMSERPTPVVICSSLSERGAEVTLEALSAGAIDFITKPKLGFKEFVDEANKDIVSIIRNAYQAKPNVISKTGSRKEDDPVDSWTGIQNNTNVDKNSNKISGNMSNTVKNDIGQSHSMGASLPQSIAENIEAIRSPVHANSVDAVIAKSTGKEKVFTTTDNIITIGASTGGTSALEILIKHLPTSCPGIAIVQHMPEKFTRAFASRLNQVSEVSVMEVDNEERLLKGTVCIASGGKHLKIVRKGAFYYARAVSGPPVNRHCPSVDVLFRSAAQAAGHNATGIILTGMGSDGAKGLKEMHDSGAVTIAQDEQSSIVFGMPKEAIKIIPEIKVVPLDKIVDKISEIYKLH